MAGGASGLADALRAAGATAAASKAAKAKAAEGDDCAKRCADIASTTKQDEEFIGWYTHLIPESYHYSSILYLYYIYTLIILVILDNVFWFNWSMYIPLFRQKCVIQKCAKVLIQRKHQIMILIMLY